MPGGYATDELAAPGNPISTRWTMMTTRRTDSAALPPPGPVLSPSDPRYGRPAAAPVYSDRGAPMPTGPILSPDDPRYGRPAGPPPVIYADRPPGGSQQPAYSDRGDSRIPGAGIVYPNDDRAGLRPPGATAALHRRPRPALPARSRSRSSLGWRRRQAGATRGAAAGRAAGSRPGAASGDLRRQEVSFATKEPAGTIVVDTSNTHLYYILGGGRAVRYGVRVGRDGFTWNGVQKISRKAEWPDWHPPTEMIERQPYLPRFMAGGPGNPLGARAMYLGSTIYRIHGTNQPSTIGKFVSSGCIGMLNDVSDLFERTKVGTRVVVLPGGAPPANTASASAAPPPSAGPAAAAAPGQASQAQLAPVPGAQPTTVPPLPAPGHNSLNGRLSNKHLRRAESAPFLLAGRWGCNRHRNISKPMGCGNSALQVIIGPGLI